MRFPLSKILAGQIPEINSDNAIFFCQSGIRSGQALEKLSGKLKARMFALKEGAKKLQSLLG
jgi:rhodanese-related sulfurtransferase